MNTLSQLNTYSNTGFSYTDDRPTTYVFDRVPDQQYVTTYENQTFIAPPAANLIAIYNKVSDVSYSINVSALPGTTVTWTGLTGNLTQSNVGNVFTVSNIARWQDWDLVKSPVVTMPANPSNWTFDSNVTYTGGEQAWGTTITVLQLDQFTAASDYYYQDNVSGIITGAPQIYTLGIAGFEPTSYTCNVASSDNTVFGNLSCSGGTFAANVLTFTGNLATINSKLSAISYWPPAALDASWIATYSLNNPNSGFTSTRTQTIKSQSDIYVDRPTSFYYDRNIPLQTVSGVPVIIDTVSNVAANYSMVITSLESGIFGNLKTTFASGTSVFSANTLTITGNKATVNSHLSTLKYTPATDYATDMHLRYQLTIPTSNVIVRIQDGLISANNTIISNMTVSRAFVSNTADQIIFPTSVPQILEVVSGATYTIYLTSTAGKFGTSSSNATATYSYTGTKTQVNALFSTIKFYPYADVVGSQTFTYQQLRNGVSQLTQNVSLIGTARVTPIPGIGTYVYLTNTTVNLSYEMANYLYVDYVLVSGGGAAGQTVYYNGNYYDGGGGGGGRILSGVNLRPTSQLIIQVGADAVTAATLNALVQNTTGSNGATGGTTSITGLVTPSTITSYGGGTGGTGGTSSGGTGTGGGVGGTGVYLGAFGTGREGGGGGGAVDQPRTGPLGRPGVTIAGAGAQIFGAGGNARPSGYNASFSGTGPGAVILTFHS